MVSAHLTEDAWQTEGVNDRVQLSRINAEVNRRILERWMRAGVTVVDPATTWVHASVDLGTDVTLLPGTSLEGATSVAAGAMVGPDTTLVDVEVGERATVIRTHGSLAVIGAGRRPSAPSPTCGRAPGWGRARKIGTFVETKNAAAGRRRQGAAPVLRGRRGDRRRRQHRRGRDLRQLRRRAQGDDDRRASFSFVGSNSVLTAPVVVGDGAYVAAGSTITGDVEVGALAVSRGRQRNVAGWVARKRAGTKTARAAEAATTTGSDPVGSAPAREQTSTSAPLQTQHAQPAPVQDQQVPQQARPPGGDQRRAPQDDEGAQA